MRSSSLTSMRVLVALSDGLAATRVQSLPMQGCESCGWFAMIAVVPSSRGLSTESGIRGSYLTSPSPNEHPC